MPRGRRPPAPGRVRRARAGTRPFPRGRMSSATRRGPKAHSAATEPRSWWRSRRLRQLIREVHHLRALRMARVWTGSDLRRFSWSRMLLIFPGWPTGAPKTITTGPRAARAPAEQLLLDAADHLLGPVHRLEHPRHHAPEERQLPPHLLVRGEGDDGDRRPVVAEQPGGVPGEGEGGDQPRPPPSAPPRQATRGDDVGERRREGHPADARRRLARGCGPRSRRRGRSAPSSRTDSTG